MGVFVDRIAGAVEAEVRAIVGEMLAPVQADLEQARATVERQAADATALLDRIDVLTAQVGDLEGENSRLLARIAELEAQQPTPERWPLHVHTVEGPASYWDAIAKRQDYGHGAFVYQSNFGGGPLRHSAFWEALYARWPEGLPVVVSPMVAADPAGLREWCERMPKAQRALTVVAPLQEPEDNILQAKSLTVAEYRRVIESYALVREYDIRLAAEVQEFTIAPGNTWGGTEDWLFGTLLAGLPLDEVHWSLYEYNAKPGRVRVERITAAMQRRLPGVPWDASAIGITVPLNATTAQRQARAENVTDTFRALKQHGAKGGGWFDVRGFAGKDRDNDTRSDVLLLEALNGAKG